MNFRKVKLCLYSLLIYLSVVNNAYSLEKNLEALEQLNKVFSQHQKLIGEGRYQDALKFSEQGYQLAKKHLASISQQRLIATDNYALNLQITENFAQAHIIFKELLTLYESKYGKHAKELLPILTDISVLQVKLKERVKESEIKATSVRRYKLYLRHNSDEFISQFEDPKLSRTQHSINLHKKVSNYFNKPFDIYETKHWSIIHEPGKEKFIKRKLAKLIEKTYRNNISFLVALGLRNKPIEQKMTAVVFTSKDDYSHYFTKVTGDSYGGENSGGVYLPREKAIFLFERGTNKKGKPLGVSPLTVAHEVSHQVMYNVGLHSLYVNYPRWFIEGLAVSFEFNNIKQSFGPHTKNYAFYTVFSIKKVMELGQLITLKELVSFNGDNEEFSNRRNQLDVYALGSLLIRFLYTYYPDKFKNYLTIISDSRIANYEQIKRGKNIRLKQFTKAFGEPELMQEKFSSFITDVIVETDLAYKAFQQMKLKNKKN